jgi:hypothetical protein
LKRGLFADDLEKAGLKWRRVEALYVVVVSWTSKVKVTCHNPHFSKTVGYIC